MFNKPQQSAKKTLILTLSLIAIFLFGNAFDVIQAQPAPTGTGAPQGAAPEGQTNVVCQVEMGKFLEVELNNYHQFMETNFQNKSSTSSLLEDGMGKYREFRKTIMDKYSTFYPQQGASLLTEGLEPDACLGQVEDALSEARRTLDTKARSTSAVKKTTALISKYQEINGKLRKLNQTFITMKSYLDTFAAKLPCYIRKSCNKG
jgi:hypothetical protein